MATVAENGLFPPILEAYLPAFNVSEISSGLKIYFALSKLESQIDNIQSIHISLTRQSNYHSLFNSNDYTRGIIIEDFSRQANKTDSTDPIEYQGDEFYKVTIPFNTLDIYKELVYNTYYKLQVRMSKDENPHLTGTGLAQYLANEAKLPYFSEWSTVSLLRFIAPRDLSVSIGDGTFQPGSGANVTSSALTLFGTYKPQSTVTIPEVANVPEAIRNGANDQEYLVNYRVKVYDDEDNLVADSGDLQPQNLNEINYDIPYYFPIGNTTVTLSLTTANLHNEEVNCVVTASYDDNTWGSQSYITEVTGIDTVIGKVGISFEPAEGSVIPADSEIMIRRADNTDDFGHWSTIYTKNITENITTHFEFNDFTIESGTIYKYQISFTYDSHTYTIVEGPILSVFDNAFLTGEGTQLCVKFNTNLSTFKRNVSDNVVNTIGSKYPYITRNGHMDYRSFGLSGTIAYEMDAEHQFSTRSSIYGDWIDVYGSYFVNHYYNQKNDKVTQRKFREMVMNFLYDDIPKLFRSTPEGNILVRITDVTLTPNQTLGRMIYDFSCTATEIGDATVENYKLYKIQDFGDN